MIDNVNIIASPYAKTETKQNGSTLLAAEWNAISDAVETAHSKINDIIENGTSSSSSETPQAASNVTVTNATVSGEDPKAQVAIVSGITEIGSPVVMELTKKKKGVNTSIVSGNNINIEPRESVDSTKGGNISLKPGDDIELCSHHRVADNLDEVSVKVINGNDEPVKLQINAASATLTTKDKVGDDANVFDINVNSGKNTKGYLKVRAQAIDLRCEDHGGIALQPKGEDSDHHMNKIKFEHGGGDGLEFGTFNAEKTSIFTDEYRFNRDGVWKMATRRTKASDKADPNDPTTTYKYRKNTDDFYDFFRPSDRQTATTRQIIKTADALNGLGIRAERSATVFDLIAVDEYVVAYELTPEQQSLYNDNEILLLGNDAFVTLRDYFSEGSTFTPYEVIELISVEGTTNAQSSGITGGTSTISTTLPAALTSNPSVVKLTDDSSAYGHTEGVDDFIYLVKLDNVNVNINIKGKESTVIGAGDASLMVGVSRSNNDIATFSVDKINVPGATELVNLTNSDSVTIADIITLVNYFKTGAGASNGPWASQL